MQFRTNCHYWRGDKPCRENRLCAGCRAYEKLGPRLLVIKLGARGDVLRTTPLVEGLKRRWPNAHVTWLTSPASLELLDGLPGLDRSLPLSLESVLELEARRFEGLFCLDKEPWALGLAGRIQARRKFGWGMAADGTGTPACLNPEAAYSLALGVSDELKFRQNQKTYLEIIFSAAGLNYAGERYAFSLREADRSQQRAFFAKHRITPRTPCLGLYLGCGPAFQHKRWTESGFARLAERAHREWKARVVLMAGPEEQEIAERVRRFCRAPVLNTGGRHSLREFAAFVEACRLLVTGDTLALHLALALKRRVVALFGPTCSQEIDLFQLGEKVISPIDCAPCYRRTCEQKPHCMESLTVDRVWEAAQRVWEGEA